ncbi:hypothetical protein P691DRAFT_571428 [Macrolepiota fuliginosa MF-IS2]|uniref:Uncharacterized protein n=1 Tax=Macrolepiota fuliginosa MF-IS2 TaxID=1400762 RepID=A0A9P5XE31_9AGAR|nr:hypothetical protein P691DRAFT_571428 [Macrolepiota fuliginosa MF-IS2]
MLRQPPLFAFRNFIYHILMQRTLVPCWWVTFHTGFQTRGGDVYMQWACLRCVLHILYVVWTICSLSKAQEDMVKIITQSAQKQSTPFL